MGSSESGVSRCDSLFLHGAPSAETRGEDEKPPRGMEACLGTLAVSADPAPGDSEARIPTGSPRATGGITSPSGVSSSTYGPFAVPTELRGASPACSRARWPGHPTALLPGLLGLQGRPSQTEHSRWAACPAGPRCPPRAQPTPQVPSSTPPAPAFPPSVGISLVLQDHCPPGCVPTGCCPQGPRPGLIVPANSQFSRGSRLHGAQSGRGSGTTLVRVLTPTPFTAAATA